MLKAAASIDMIHVPYSGAAPAMNALLAGDVNTFCGAIPRGAPHIAVKNAIALGVTGETESTFLPGVPPPAARYPNLVISTWSALFAPSRTPSPVTEALRAELHKVFADAEMQTKLFTRLRIGMGHGRRTGPEDRPPNGRRSSRAPISGRISTSATVRR